MVCLFLDIETIPGDESLKSEIEQGLLKPRGPKKKSEESTEQKNMKAEDVEKKFRQTALDGDFGRILCIGYCKEPPVDSKVEVLTGAERTILSKFWDISKDVELFIGHNLMDFDLKFIYKRSIILGVKPSKNLSFARYRSEPIYDTMKEWNKWDMSGFTSLDLMARIMGFKSSKEKLSGDKVYDFYLDGKEKEICDYCKADVELTRKIYKKMAFCN